MTHSQIREKFLKFFESRGHKIVPSSSLLPEDSTTLFTSSGMQPLLPYFLGKPHPEGKRVADSQKSFRAEDIEEVGDNRHTTFFEMLGNWSFGDYWKKEQLNWAFEFLTKEVGIDPKNLYVTVFSGGYGIPKDDESIDIWKSILGSKAEYVELGSLDDASKKGMKEGQRIFGYVDKNWWSRSGKPDQMPAGEPGGPDSEMFYDFGSKHDSKYGPECHPNCDCGRFIEIGNSVFMEFRKKEDGSFEPLPQKNVDFGGGLERISAASENKQDVFQTSAFKPIVDSIQTIAGKDYEGPNTKYPYRVIADHIKASVFLIADGVTPSNKLQGYVLRRLIRRAIRYGHSITFKNDYAKLVNVIDEQYGAVYPEVRNKKQQIILELQNEFNKFIKTLEKGLKVISDLFKKEENIGTFALNDSTLFDLYQNYGFPVELSLEEIDSERVNRGLRRMDDSLRNMYSKNYHELLKKLQQKSRPGEEQKQGGHGLLMDTGELKAGNEEELKKATRLHTATHLLHAALRKVLGIEVHQAGSDITPERLRFDFTFPRKLTPEEIKEVEDMVNEAVQKDYPVTKEEMAYKDAIKSGAMAFFKLKYPPRVNVYSVGDFSKELCGGPHVSHSAEIGRVKIVKEEAVSSGVRRIRATVD